METHPLNISIHEHTNRHPPHNANPLFYSLIIFPSVKTFLSREFSLFLSLWKRNLLASCSISYLFFFLHNSTSIILWCTMKPTKRCTLFSLLKVHHLQIESLGKGLEGLKTTRTHSIKTFMYNVKQSTSPKLKYGRLKDKWTSLGLCTEHGICASYQHSVGTHTTNNIPCLEEESPAKHILSINTPEHEVVTMSNNLIFLK